MKIQSSAVTLAIVAFIGCSARLHMYPVRGPLAAQRTVPVITAKATGLTSGTIRFQLPTGEICEGRWAAVPREQVDNGLATVWDSIYGAGSYVAHVLGSQWHGKAVLIGNRGASVELEFYRDTVKDSPLQGVAQDKEGNVYKITQ